ncbi:uncharacterized protein LOC129613891 [Condylostylus longicornis]|uniref:uncharacterized protein LOC129613891 n=1 Tax=Condylostylus longicornis TaxID=2530218 RepID=UPI00244DBE5C|nr:uncharacterized protein LOC129613891 [Condylostylus longicornis]
MTGFFEFFFSSFQLVVLLCIGNTIAIPQYNYNPPHQGAGLGPIGGTGPSGIDEPLGGGLLDVRGGNIGPAPSFASSSSAHATGGHIGGFQNFAGGHGSGGFVPSTGAFGGNRGHFGGGAANLGGHGAGGGSGFGGFVGGGNFAGFGGSAVGSNGFSGGNAGFIGHGGAHQNLITKQFFIHSAPEEQDEVGGDKVINLGPGRKHYRVVFIKAPHQGVQGGRVRFIAPANEEKTVIYVLSKKTDLADIAADVQQAHTEPTKPDVFFIKYKTPEEAAHAQRQIQAQYDQLGGTSQVSDEGVAPVSSVIGALGHGSGDAGHTGHGGHGFTSGGSSGLGAGIGGTAGGISNAISVGTGGGHIGHIGGGSGATYLPPNH